VAYIVLRLNCACLFANCSSPPFCWNVSLTVDCVKPMQILTAAISNTLRPLNHVAHTLQTKSFEGSIQSVALKFHVVAWLPLNVNVPTLVETAFTVNSAAYSMSAQWDIPFTFQASYMAELRQYGLIPALSFVWLLFKVGAQINCFAVP
jgi:hypothetical protein